MTSAFAALVACMLTLNGVDEPAVMLPADEPPSAPTTQPTTAPSAEVAALLAKLSSPDVAERDAAQIALLDLGEAALPALDAARRDVRDADVQVRLDTLLVQIRERADIGASKVTLKYEDAPLDEVLASFGKQARTDFGAAELMANLGAGRAGDLPRITLDLQNVSFWRALQEIQDGANVIFYPQPDGWRVQRNFGQQNTVRGTESGAFLVQPLNASYQRSISYSRNMGVDGENFSLSFQALGEPKVKLASGTGMMTLERAVDSNGNDLLGQQRGQQVSTGNGQNAIMCGIQLKYPKDPGATIAEIRGMLRISIARRSEQISSDDLLGEGKVNATVDNLKIRIDAGNDGAPAGGVAMTVTLDAGGDTLLGQRMQQNFPQMMRLTDSRDVRMQLTNYNVVRSDGRGVVLRLVMSANQPQLSKGPFKLRIDVPTSFREIDVPFVMKDLRMP